MAGGEGSRLRPLTCDMPKPMVPVLDQPIMTHIVKLLKQHQIDNIGVTLQYMPEVIRNHFASGTDYNINLKYFIEETPLGTAGSVKNAEKFLDETFMVISGDALTDFDLSKAIDFHRRKRAIATLILTKVSCPLEYGVVITGDDGSIKQFLEKPSWSEVFSDTVNTGIYLLEPEVLDYIPAGKKFDFSKDLFPLLLKNGHPLYGVILSGYWCDIGDLKQYAQAHFDFLSGAVSLNTPGIEIQPGVFVGQNVQIDASAKISGPAFIGDSVTIGPKVRIEQCTVIGSGCTIQEGASIKRSVVWNNVFIAPRVSLRGCVLGSRTQVQSGSNIYEGAVVGSNSLIKERCVINPDVKLWPHKMVETGSVVRESMVWGNRVPRRIFGLEGVSGITNLEITPEFASRMASAFASALGADLRFCVSSDIYTPSRMIRDAVICGFRSVGAQVYCLADGITPMHRFGVRQLKCDGGMHIRMSPRNSNEMNIIFTNQDGGNISRSLERKVENILAREDFKRANFTNITEINYNYNIPQAYIQLLLDSVKVNVIKRKGLSVAAIYDRNSSGRFLEPLLQELNINLERIILDDPVQLPLNWHRYNEMNEKVAETVVEKGLSMGVIIDSGADHLALIDNLGRTVKDDMLVALTALLILRSRGETVVVPVTAPRAVDMLAEKYGARVIRTKTTVQDFYEKLMQQDSLIDNESEWKMPQSLLHFDALAGIIKIIEYLSLEDINLADLIDEIPLFFMERKETKVPWEAKGTVIRSLIDELSDDNLELLDGVKVYHQDGWALVLPDPEEPICRIFSEGTTMEIAESLADFYIEKIKKIIEPVKKIG